MSDIKETTIVILKPDAIRRGLIGKIVSRLEDLDLKLIECKHMALNQDTVAEFYKHVGEELSLIHI